MVNRDSLKQLANEYSLRFPRSFEEFATSPGTATEYEFGDRTWWMARDVLPYDDQSGLSLHGPSSINGNPDVPFAAILRQHADSVREFFEDEATSDSDGNPFSFDRLSSSPAIGEDNGDYLFIDCESEAVYVFHHDGANVEKIAPSFDEFLTQSKPADR